MDEECAMFNIESFPFITQVRIKNFIGELGGRICLNNEQITPQQQKGPTCGLVALSMCLEHFGVSATADEILEKAKKNRYSKQGEMYSVHFLADLTNDFLPNSAAVREIPDAKKFSEAIRNGRHFLMAYDCGPNYQPVLMRGNSAHWLLACGFVEVSEGSGFVESRKVVEDPDKLAILGYQGKSKTLDVFPFREILASNDQLLEAGTKRNPDEYIIPNPNDLSELRNRVVEIGLHL